MSRNGVSIVQGEVSLLLSSIRRGHHWSGTGREESRDPLIKDLYSLQSTLSHTSSLADLDVSDVIGPFCAIVQSDDTTGPITGMAISSLEKFLSYELIDGAHSSAASGVETLSEAVTHARFVGTNPASDEVVLMRIIEVLRTLLLSPVGRLLSNESVCEVMQSCFRICFEMRLSELLRCLAESTLVSMVGLLFSRLGQFSEESLSIDDTNSLIDQTLSQLPVVEDRVESLDGSHDPDKSIDGESVAESADLEGSHELEGDPHEEGGVASVAVAPHRHKPGSMCPYGLPCIKELLRFLTSIINTTEKSNSEAVVAIGLNLITVVIETGSTHLCSFTSLHTLVQDNLCHYLLNLLDCETFVLFSRALKCLFLLFHNCRHDLKLQLEIFMNRLMELASLEITSTMFFEKKQLCLECIVQLSHIEHFAAELFVNFDCGLYSSNVFENLTKTLSKNSFPSQGALFPTHLLALDALLAINDNLGHMTSNNPAEFIQKDEEATKVVPTPKELLETRQRKKLIIAATEQFNKKAKMGVAFLQEQGVFSSSQDPLQIATFLLENPSLSKTQIGEYIANRKNIDILTAFVSLFPIKNVSLVDALRTFLEAFRLVGESAIVERTLEAFSQHWLENNYDNMHGQQFANTDAVHVLTYAIMMLNTDLHSTQIKKKMTEDEFVHNQRGTNNKMNFPREFLVGVYNKIKEEEIIMPEEHSGKVKSNYIWKVMLQRSATEEGLYHRIHDNAFDHDLFLLSWGPTVTALSYVFDSAEERTIVEKTVAGFSKCASVAARYELKEVFDNLIISLCKFTTLLNTPESANSLYFSLGVNPKVRQSVQTMFSLAQQHGDILREGWQNLLDCLLALFKAKLLPDSLIEVSDFLATDGKVSLYHEEAPARQDSSILSSLYSYWLPSNDQGKALTPSEIKARKTALKCIQDCHPELLFTESKFLRNDSLSELLKALQFASRGPDAHASLGTSFDEESAVFFLELLVTVAMENKDRVMLFWGELSNHLSRIIISAGSHGYLLERGVVSLLRLVARLLNKENNSQELLGSLRVILSLPPPTKAGDLHKQAANGIAELIQARASLIKTQSDWMILFAIIDFIGLGISSVSHDADLESDSPVQKDWVIVNELSSNSFDQIKESITPIFDSHSFFKCCEILSNLVRSDSLMSPNNFPLTLSTIRKFTEIASIQGPRKADEKRPQSPRARKDKSSKGSPKQGKSALMETRTADKMTFTTASLKLLDLLDALYTRVPHIYKENKDEWAEQEVGVAETGYSPGSDESTPKGGVLWRNAWRPLLQGMARLCCDSRRAVRQTAITYLQRALLAHELQTLSAVEWSACFQDVFFPMLSRLLGDLSSEDRGGVEETRVRGSNLLCKVFLQHLPSLSQLMSFDDLWMSILDYMDNFLHLDNSDLLYEAIPESLKNMLLVMSTQGVFDITSVQSDSLWQKTQERIEKILPSFLRELFPGLGSHDSNGVAMTTSPVGGSPVHSNSASPVRSSPITVLESPPPENIEGVFPIMLRPPLPVAITTEPTSVQPDLSLKTDLGSAMEAPNNVVIPTNTESATSEMVVGMITGSSPNTVAMETVESIQVTPEPPVSQPVQFSASVYNM